MSDYKTRLIEEEKQLKDKIEKLYDFTQSETFGNLEGIKKSIMLIQLEAMRAYWRCLTERIYIEIGI